MHGNALAVFVTQENVGLARFAVAHGFHQGTATVAEDRTIRIAVHEQVILAGSPEDILPEAPGDGLGAIVPQKNPALAIHEIHSGRQAFEYRSVDLRVYGRHVRFLNHVRVELRPTSLSTNLAAIAAKMRKKSWPKNAN
jgi:hypothetical protein